ncbi:hypothetical protein AGRA3207_007524 [Actinomadura graeca]|uniref:PD-(D/E)XK endonuclease-like domain-containing protein n=1 Tax=Actinomadura graeca TaxID=2750812 RepID=A0ABX8R4J3_9ACTN|nr:hypothetical protein [Actinomadura graeca]QXJ25955.1 hypothetical protein AGRA3207_007524 [Actinomadura graeca]
MTEPRYARATRNGRYYQDPLDGVLVPSCTNVLAEWAKPALAPAAAKVTARYVMDHLPQAIRAARTPATLAQFISGATREFRRVWDERMQLGSAVHHAAEGMVLGRPGTPPPQVLPFLASYRRWMRDFGVVVPQDVFATEITVFGRGPVRYGATADLMVHLEFTSDWSDPDPRFRGRTPDKIHTPSGLWLLDLKTSLTKPASARYRDNVLQLAAIRYGHAMRLPDDTEIEVPEFAGTAVLNLRRDRYGFIPLPAGPQAFAAFTSLVPVARYAHRLTLTPCRPVAATAAARRPGHHTGPRADSGADHRADSGAVPGTPDTAGTGHADPDAKGAV